jgi:hypothetical protein
VRHRFRLHNIPATDYVTCVRNDERHREILQSAKLFWQQSRNNYLHHSTRCRELVQRVGVSIQDYGTNWDKQLGVLVGGTSYKDILSSCPYRGTDRVISKYNARRLFGKGWDDLLVIPSYDLPQHIAVFHFLGKTGNLEDSVSVPATTGFVMHRCKSEMYPSSPGTYVSEGGLAYHPEVRKAAVANKHTLVALQDPYAALQLHARHFRTNATALPLVAWVDRRHGKDIVRTQRAWTTFHRQRVILWSPTLSVAFIRQMLITQSLASMWGEPVESCCKITNLMT